MAKNRILRAFLQAWRILLPTLAIPPFIAWLQSYYGLSLPDLLTLLIVLGIGMMVYLLVVAGGHLSAIEGKIDKGFGDLSEKLSESASGKRGNPNPGNPNHQEQKGLGEPEPEQKPSGGGAFAGMVVGGALGAAGGPLGVIIGGMLGALIGNQMEYDNLQKRKRRGK